MVNGFGGGNPGFRVIQGADASLGLPKCAGGSSSFSGLLGSEHLYRCAASGPYPFGTLENRLAGSLLEEFLAFGIFIGVFKQSA